MTRTVKRAIARVAATRRNGGQVTGMAFLVAERYLLTAFHVVGDRDATLQLAQPVLHQSLILSFENVGLKGLTGQVVRDCFDEVADWALIELNEPISGIRPIPLGAVSDQKVDALGQQGTSLKFESWGFSTSATKLTGSGITIDGRVQDCNAQYQNARTYQLYSDNAAAAAGDPLYGFSGAPCLIEGAAVGILRSNLIAPDNAAQPNQPSHIMGGILYACPIDTDTLQKRCQNYILSPDLNRNLSGHARLYWLFVPTWGTIIALTVFGAFLLGSGDSKTQLTYAIIGLCVNIISAILVFKRFQAPSALALQPIFRCLFFNTQKQCATTLLLSFFAFFIAVYLASMSVRGMMYRHSYQSIIRSALDEGPGVSEDKIAEAFKIAPWRKEAQFIYHRIAFYKRNERAAFRIFSRNFREKIEESAINYPTTGNIPWFIWKNDKSVYSNPIIFLASIYPEAEEEHEIDFKKRAVEILHPWAYQPQAQMLKLYLEYAIASTSYSDSNPVEIFNQLRVSIEDFARSLQYFTPQSYLVAADMVAQAYMDKDPCDAQYAAEWYRKIVSARIQASQSSDRLLLWNSPIKLSLYHLFRYQESDILNDEKPLQQEVKKLLDHCPQFQENLTELRMSYPELKTRIGWSKGTVAAADFGESIRNHLEKGWRF